MKTPYSCSAAVIAAFSAVIFAAAPTAVAGECCAMMKKQAVAPAGCCCCADMQAKPADVTALVEQMKTASGDQLLATLAAVLNKLIEERKAGPAKPAEAPTHQH